MKKEQKALAKYLIVTAMIDLCSFYYVAGYFAKFLINHVTGTSSDGFKLAMGLTNLTFYLLFIAAFVFFYKKIVGCIDKMITATFYLWGVFILSNPVISQLVLKSMTQAAIQTQTLSVHADRAAGWALHAVVICSYMACTVITGCYLRQIKFIILAALLLYVYFGGWYDSLIGQGEVMELHNFIKFGNMLITGLMLLLPTYQNHVLRENPLGLFDTSDIG